MKKIKILYMTGRWNHAGTEVYMLNVFDHIDRMQYELNVALPGEYKQPYEDSLIQRGIRVIHYPAGSIRQQIKAAGKILDEGGYDVVHVMQNYIGRVEDMYFALAAIAERKRHHYKVICHSHNMEDSTRKISPVKKAVRSVFRSMLRRMLSHADLQAACSRGAGDFLYGSKRNVEILYNGVDLRKFISAGSSDLISKWREKYGIDANKKNFVAVGRLAEQKNVLFTLDVVNTLCRYEPELRFTWVGDGELRTEMEAHIKMFGLEDRVKLLGLQDHVEEILACCDYFLLPSKYEGLGIVFLEAQAAGMRCFTSDRVPKDADCGGVTFLSLEKTAEQWAEEIHRQIETEPKAKIDMVRLNKFDINRTVAELSEVYNRLVERQ